MTNAFSTALTWVEKETGIIKQDVVAIEPQILAWAKNFLAQITPVIEKAVTDAVLAAVEVPGDGATKFAAAVATAGADLAAQGIPIAKQDLHAAVQIAYNALPTTVQSNAAAVAVEGVVDNAIDSAATKVQAAAPVAPAARVTPPAV